jgi:hypothetical protein
MSDLWVEIEALVLDGVPMNSVQGRCLAEQTEIALTRLLEQRGVSKRVLSSEAEQHKKEQPLGSQTMHLPVNANEARWAEELALALYRAMDRIL